MFVRWLNAYCGTSYEVPSSAVWELTQTAREVATEPLFFGRSLLLEEQGHVFVGLVCDEDKSIFRAGFLGDAYSVTERDGTLRATSGLKPVRDLHRFKAGWQRKQPERHGEAFFDLFTARAVAVRSDAKPQQVAQSKELASKLGLAIVRIDAYQWRAKEI